MHLFDHILKRPVCANEEWTVGEALSRLNREKEPFLFVRDGKKIIGYLRKHELMAVPRKARDHQTLSQLSYSCRLLKIHNKISLLDFFKVVGEEVILVEDEAGNLKGYVSREDFLIEMMRQGDLYMEWVRTLLCSVPFGLFVVDREGRFLNWNDEAVHMTNLAGDVRQMQFGDIFDETYYEHVIRTGEALLNQIIVNDEMSILADFSPVTAENGDIEGMVVIVQDLPVVEQMAMELGNVKDLNKDLQAILSSIYDEILVTNARGELIRYSDNLLADFWETDPADMIGQNLVELEKRGLFHPSVTRLVLEQKKKVSVIQEGHQGRRVLAVGNPVFGEDGELERIVIASRDITETYRLENELRQLKALSQKYKQELDTLRQKLNRHPQLIYASEAMMRVMADAEKVAKVSSTVLLTGESGVGKEVVARAIHEWGPRSDRPFIKINCGAIPENLLESELFGYEKGAFTGADPAGKKGYFQQADKGILFLDEISELPLNLQVKLLRVLQEREVIPVGGTRVIPVDVQIIAATNRDLDRLVEEGRFREDLFYRLNVIPIPVPPLRDRVEDIALLTYHFLQQFNRKYDRNVQISQDALDILEVYPWPGNVRELQNVIERLVVTLEEEQAGAHHVTRLLHWKKAQTRMKPIVTHLMPLKDAQDAIEEQLILMAMERYKTTTMAAKMLGVSQSTISRKYQKIQERIRHVAD
ncbi:MAG: sigma 54-interacting transcriptional regulator [Bacillaceae bacterium]|nr:sigma 54-interacting transcriptional regulator [Bacillaceae bacterium]